MATDLTYQISKVYDNSQLYSWLYSIGL